MVVVSTLESLLMVLRRLCCMRWQCAGPALVVMLLSWVWFATSLAPLLRVVCEAL